MEVTKLVRWPRIVIGCAALMMAGVIYTWSIINVPFEEFWDSTQLGINFTITIIFFCTGGFFSGFISRWVSSTIRLLIAAVLLSLSFFISSRLFGGSIIPLYFAYGVMGGTGIGFTYNTVISTTNAWFPDKQGLCSGILLTSFGLSALILGRIADIMGHSEAIGWRNTYVILAIAIAVILLASSQLVKLPPKGMVFPETIAKKTLEPISDIKDVPARELIRTPLFYAAFIGTSLIASSGNAAISFARNIVLDVGASASLAVTMVGILAVFNGGGRIIAGWLYDNVGMRRAQIIYGATSFIGPLLVVIALAADSLFFGIAGIGLCGFSYGYTPTSVSVFTLKFFGPKNFSINYGIMNMILLPASLAATLAGRIKDMTGEFLIAFVILTILSGVGSIIVAIVKRR